MAIICFSSASSRARSGSPRKAPTSTARPCEESSRRRRDVASGPASLVTRTQCGLKRAISPSLSRSTSTEPSRKTIRSHRLRLRQTSRRQKASRDSSSTAKAGAKTLPKAKLNVATVSDAAAISAKNPLSPPAVIEQRGRTSSATGSVAGSTAMVCVIVDSRRQTMIRANRKVRQVVAHFHPTAPVTFRSRAYARGNEDPAQKA